MSAAYTPGVLRLGIADGTYRVALSRSADDHKHEATVAVAGRTFGA